MSASTPPDDLDAVRAVIDAVKDFNKDDQQRIFRWAAEKLGLPQPFGTSGTLPTHAPPIGSPRTPLDGPPIHTPSASEPRALKDIKSFVLAKAPRSDVQFAATVAYYYQFEAPPSEKKDAINGEDLQDACRKVGRERLKRPGQTLINAQNLGLLDKGAETGTYSVNTVGENLVAMTLPGDGNSGGKPVKRTRRKAPKKRTTGTRSSKKGTSKKA